MIPLFIAAGVGVAAVLSIGIVYFGSDIPDSGNNSPEDDNNADESIKSSQGIVPVANTNVSAVDAIDVGHFNIDNINYTIIKMYQEKVQESRNFAHEIWIISFARNCSWSD